MMFERVETSDGHKTVEYVKPETILARAQAVGIPCPTGVPTFWALDKLSAYETNGGRTVSYSYVLVPDLCRVDSTHPS